MTRKPAAKQDSAPARSSIVTSVTEAAAPLILLVEDDPDDYYLVKDLMSEFHSANYQLHWVDQFDDALAFLSLQKPVICLVDYQLGARTGLDLLQEIIALGIEIPIVLLTGQGDHDMDQRAMSVGAADYLPKSELSATLLERTIKHAIERASLLQQLKDQARVDVLTGLYNRRYLDERLDELIESSHRYHLDLSLALGDLDHFKHINDGFGHHAGDLALKIFSDILKRNVRQEDLVCRYGGDEFLIVFPHVKPLDAAISIERMLQELKSQTISCADDVSFSLTASFGITSLKSNMNKKDVIRNADQALYRAKSAGRGRFEIF